MFAKQAPPVPPTTTPPPISVINEVTKAIEHILRHPPRRKAPGPAGERYEHYSVVANMAEHCHILAQAITHLALGSAPSEVIQHYASAQLIPLLKPNGKIRPIACGTAIRRIATTATAKVLTPYLTPVFEDHQYALGRTAGAEELHKTIQARLLQN